MIKSTVAVAFILVSTSFLMGQAACKAPYSPDGAGWAICPGDTLKLAQPGVFVKDLDFNRNTFALLVGEALSGSTVYESGFFWTRDILKKSSTIGTVKDLGTIKTASGPECIRIVSDSERGGKHRTIIYYFCPATKPAFISASSPSMNDGDLLAFADTIVKTFAIKK